MADEEKYTAYVEKKDAVFMSNPPQYQYSAYEFSSKADAEAFMKEAGGRIRKLTRPPPQPKGSIIKEL